MQGLSHFSGERRQKLRRRSRSQLLLKLRKRHHQLQRKKGRAKNGLKRGENGLEIYVICEIPNNVILVDEFSKLFDGFSIGSNDLTQLVLGVDRDSALVAHDFDERDPGVMRMISMAIQGASRNHRHCGLAEVRALLGAGYCGRVVRASH